MARPGKLDLVIVQGDSFLTRLEFTDDASTPIDMTGWTGRAQMRKVATSSTVLATFTVDFVDAAGGVIEVSLADSVTTELAAGSNVWDLELTDDAAAVRTWLAGKVTVLAEVTR